MKEKSEDLNIQIQYKLVEELTRTNESLQEKIQQNKKQLDETRKLIKDLQIINNFSKVIQESKTIEDITWSIVREAVAQLGFGDCVIYLFDSNREFLLQTASLGLKNKNGERGQFV